MSEEILQRLIKIFANQQKILQKLAQPAPPTPLSPPALPAPSDSFEDEYDPEERKRDLKSDLREAVRALKGEELSDEELEELLKQHMG